MFTKVGWDYGDPDRKGLSKHWIADAVDALLSLLGVDAIDLYFSHQPDPATPQAETLAAHDAWTIARPGVTAPIASATSATQVESFAKAVDLRFSAEEIALLDTAGA